MSFAVNSSSSMQRLSSQLSSGKQINSAADNAAGLGIAEKLRSQEGGLNQGTRNTADMQSLVRTADGVLGSINDNLQRLNELALQASNGILTQSDRGLIQLEVNQIIENIDTMAQSTQFNTRNLLDGSVDGLNTASGADGRGQQISISSMSAQSLGISGFNVTNPSNIDLGAIATAMSTVNGQRTDIGAASNRMDFVMSSNDIASLNMASSRSRIEDTDMAKAMSDMSKARVLEQYQVASKRRQMEQMETQTQRLFNM